MRRTSPVEMHAHRERERERQRQRESTHSPKQAPSQRHFCFSFVSFFVFILYFFHYFLTLQLPFPLPLFPASLFVATLAGSVLNMSRSSSDGSSQRGGSTGIRMDAGTGNANESDRYLGEGAKGQKG